MLDSESQVSRECICLCSPVPWPCHHLMQASCKLMVSRAGNRPSVCTGILALTSLSCTVPSPDSMLILPIASGELHFWICSQPVNCASGSAMLAAAPRADMQHQSNAPMIVSSCKAHMYSRAAHSHQAASYMLRYQQQLATEQSTVEL